MMEKRVDDPRTRGARKTTEDKLGKPDKLQRKEEAEEDGRLKT